MQNRYPIWKNIMLVCIFVIGLIYALPTFFGEDPAVQISASGSAVVDASTLTQVNSVLKTQGLAAKNIEQSKDSLLVRFADTDTQLKARDIIKAALGENYIVALNLAPRTPHWLVALGANPMKLGLDLRGGVSFLLEVDTNALIKAREEGDVRSIGEQLREANIRYAGIERLQPHGMIIRFRDMDNLNNASTELKKRLPDYLITQAQNAEGAESGVSAKSAVASKSIGSNNEYKLQVMMSDAAVLKISDYAIDQTMNILRNRVNALGVSEAIVQREGTNNVSVQLPGIQDTARAKDIIGKTATLKFQMVDVEHDAESAVQGDVPLGSKVYEYEGHHVLLKDQVILQGDSITYADSGFSQQDGRPTVNVHLGGGGESMFHRVTAENIGKPMAVVYVETKNDQQLVNGKLVNLTRLEERVISIATIQSALGNNFEITGLKSPKYAQDLALLLRSGALVAPMNFLEEETVGPSMGQANIHMGVVSIIVGFIFVVLFMAFYYRLFGLFADMALFLNLIFIVAILAILGAVLTLPGMAAMVLTVGMAVDSNVLIYERIREELRNGISPQASIYAGYERALTTIVDANISTLIVAIVLFALGTGPVKGFAITLTIGLMTSMLTAIVYTRAVVNYIYGRKIIKKLSIGI